MNENVLREFLVSLGFAIDEVGMKKFVTAVEGVTKSVKTVGLEVAAAATGIVAGVKIISSQMENLYYASQRTGATVGNIMALRYAASQIGLTADQAQGALENFARTLRLNPGSSSLLDSLGVTGKDPAEKFDSFIGKMKQMQPYVAAAYAQLFGIDPDTLLMLEQGQNKRLESERQYHLKLAAFGINPDQAALSGVNFNNSIRSVTDTLKDLWIVIESRLTPVLTPLVDQFERWAETHAGEVAQGIADAVKSLANWINSVDWKKVGDDITDVYHAIGGLKGILIGLAAIQLLPLVTGILSLASAVTGLGAAGTAASAGGLVGLLGSMAGMGLLGYGAYKAINALKDSTTPGHFVSRRGGARPTDSDAPAHDWNSTWESIKAAFNYGGTGHFVGRGDRNAHGSTSGTTYDPLPSSGSTSAPTGTASTADLFSSLEKSFGLAPGTLDKVWNIESGRGKRMLSPAGAKGHFQFMDDTAKQYGVNDPNDLAQSAKGAAKYLHDLMLKYAGDMGKAIAAYNWGQGNLDKDIAQHGADWANFVPQETAGYLQKFNGTRLGANAVGSNSSVAMSQTNTFHITGSNDPQGTARAVASEQYRVYGDMVRNFSGAVQ